MEVNSPNLRKGYSWRFYVGVALVVLSIIIGLIAKILIFIYINDLFWFWFNVVVYILSWPILILGVWWVGKEYADKIRRYVSYKFYQESIKKGTTKVYRLTKEKTHYLTESARSKSIQLRDKARDHSDKIKSNLRNKVKLKSPFKIKKK